MRHFSFFFLFKIKRNFYFDVIENAAVGLGFHVEVDKAKEDPRSLRHFDPPETFGVGAVRRWIAGRHQGAIRAGQNASATRGGGVPEDAEPPASERLVRHEAEEHFVTVGRDGARDVGPAEGADEGRRGAASVSDLEEIHAAQGMDFDVKIRHVQPDLSIERSADDPSAVQRRRVAVGIAGRRQEARLGEVSPSAN